MIRLLLKRVRRHEPRARVVRAACQERLAVPLPRADSPIAPAYPPGGYSSTASADLACVDHLPAAVAVICAATMHHCATGLRNWQRENSRMIWPNDLPENCSAHAAEKINAEILQTFPRVCGFWLLVKKSLYNNNLCMAEREGFEPPIRLPVRRISSAVLSTTQPPLRSGM